MVARSTKPPQRARSTKPPNRSPSGGAPSSAPRSLPPVHNPLAQFAIALDETPTQSLPTLHDDEIDGSRTDQTAVLAPTSMRSAQRPTLMVLAGAAAGKVFTVDSKRFTIGRGKASNLTLSDQGVSRTHCAIVADDGGRYFIEDLVSTNGTLVNGVRVKRIELNAGDRFQVGADAVLQFGFFDAAEEGLVNQLYESATRDPLTRALNRRAFQDRLMAEISYAIRHREKLVAILLDIDHFKKINDSHGHATGDVVLRDVAKAIATTLRHEDVFARYGGEEFVLLARGLKLANGAKLAERIRHLVETSDFGVAERPLRVTLSAGVAEFNESTNDVTGEMLLRLADGRLYVAKSEGRNRVVAK
jgi:two-component system, cell cycle response regulator